MEREKFFVSASPHIHEGLPHRADDPVLIALMPVVLASGMIFGARAWLVVAVCAVSCVAFEALYCWLAKRPEAVKDCSALVTGVILACNLPANIPCGRPWWAALRPLWWLKQLFGGLGTNFANPALVGRLALFIGFASYMTNYAYPVNGGIDLVASATTDAVASGHAAGCGRNSGRQHVCPVFGPALAACWVKRDSLALLLGGIYLILTGTISAIIPVSYLGTVAVLSAILGHDVLVQLLSGGLMLGAFFMATDYVTSPFTRLGKLVFGIGAWLHHLPDTFLQQHDRGRQLCAAADEPAGAYINELTRQRPLGEGEAQMKETLKPIFVLTGICLIVAVLLAATNGITRRLLPHRKCRQRPSRRG